MDKKMTGVLNIHTCLIITLAKRAPQMKKKRKKQVLKVAKITQHAIQLAQISKSTYLTYTFFFLKKEQKGRQKNEKK